MLTLEYAISREDFISFCMFTTWDAPDNDKKRRRYYLKQIGTIVLFTAAFYYTGLFDRSSKFSFIVIGWIVLTAVISMYGARSAVMKQAERAADDPDNANIFSHNLLHLSETGLLIKDEFSETKFQWNAFIKKQEDDHYYFLFYNSLQAIIIPKRVFKNADETVFKELLTRFLSFDAEVGHLIKN